MSDEILEWVRKHSPTKGGDRLLLMVMAHLADETGHFVASDRDLSGPCNVTPKAVAKGRARLGVLGALETLPRFGPEGQRLANGYRVIAEGAEIVR